MAGEKYYPIDEEAARRAKEANSHGSYREGSATESYQASVDRAVRIGKEQKKAVDPCFHDRIDYLVDLYARKLAENLNEGYRIAARVPSLLVAGGAGIQAGKKQKQVEDGQRNHQKWQEIQGILERIRSTGMGGISADRENALELLEEKLRVRETRQEKMRSANAYYRKHGTLEGCEALSPEEIHSRMKFMEDMLQPKPYPTYSMANNSAEIRRVKKRIEELKRNREVGFCGWEFTGGKAETNQEYNRLQLFFDEKPSLEQRGFLRRAGFHWVASAGAWQRQLNWNAIRAAERLEFVKPLDGRSPSEIQPKAEKRHLEKKGDAR